jgi:ferrochelatase
VNETGQAESSKIGVLLTNLGTPDAPTKAAVRPFLKELLSDPRVVGSPPPRWLWMLILNGLILNIRPKKSAKKYQSIWNTHGKGSPLLAISKKQKNAVESALNEHSPEKFSVVLGMRYGNPSIASALRDLESENCEKILVLPLYPQFASSSTGSSIDAVSREVKKWHKSPEMCFIDCYNEETSYIQSLANSVKEFQEIHGTPDLLLMSYHGIPKSQFDKGDQYPSHCMKTTYLLASKLNLHDDDYKMTFQSRVGVGEWVKDYTDETLKSLPGKGVKNVQVICPGFSADCLETIEEIGEENRSYFMDSGGDSYNYIPALNDRRDHINCLTQMIINKSEELKT